MIIPLKLKRGDTIGVVAPSGPIIGENVEELEKAKKIVEKLGFNVKYAKNLFLNQNEYSNSAEKKAEDINEMFENKNVKMIWCAKGGENSNSTFDYLNFELIKNNPKIICGYSDITSITNIITEKTGLVTFSGTNFKTIATDETDYSLKQAIHRFVDGDLKLGDSNDEYKISKDGVAIKMPHSQQEAKNVLDKVGWDLEKAYTYSYSMPYYGHTDDMPQDSKPGIEWYADYGFTNYKGNCYVMASVFCRLAEMLDYDVKQISGSVPLRTGGYGPHSWTEIVVDGKIYVCDPDFQNETKKNGYLINYGQSGTWRYKKEEVMS